MPGPQRARTVPTYSAHKPQEVTSDHADEPPVLVASPPASLATRPFPEICPLPPHLLQPRLPRDGARTRAFRRTHFSRVSDKEWHDWHWQLRQRVRDLAGLERFLTLSQDERQALDHGGAMLPVAVTPYYLSLLDPDDPQQPLRRSMIPVTAERLRVPGEADDPLGEEDDTPVPGIVHRYPDRVLFLVHDDCASYCRYCTRSRVVGQGAMHADRQRLEVALDYIRRTPAVRDVLMSGGDPLTLSDEKLDWILGELRRIPHVQIIRIGTKVPAVLPQRVTPQLVRMLRRHHPLMISIHATHPDEATPEMARACRRLADAGIPLGSQTVLLRGINDDPSVMTSLMHRLLSMRVRPYYLYQCDPISGSAHFRTTIARGLEVIGAMRGWTSGYAVPTYVIDAPGGGGKIPLQRQTVVGRDGPDLILRNHEGGEYRYPDHDHDREVML